jgi:valyl-tRNA synthetase
MKGYSAFANKVWNAARFVLMNLTEKDPPVSAEAIDSLLTRDREGVALEDRWVLHRLNQVSGNIAEALDKFRFHDASSEIYQFFWHELCDWYVELIKPVLAGESVSAPERSRRVAVLVHVLDYSLRLLHPFMPFITEEIWQRLPHVGDSIMIQEFPRPRAVRENAEAFLGMQVLMDLTVGLRSARAEMNIDPKKTLDARLVARDPAIRALVQENLEKIKLLARLAAVEFAPKLLDDRVQLKGVWKHGEFGLDLKGAIDFQAERERLQKELGRVRADIQKIVKKLNSHEFVDRAPEEVVSENRARHAELLERFERLESNLDRLPPN